MADKKISQLTSATTPLAGTEVLPIVQSGSTVKVSSDDLTVKNVRSNATTGLLQIAGPGAGTTRVMTTPNANFTAARTDAAQTFTGTQTFASTAGNGLKIYGGSGTNQWDIYLNSTNLRFGDNTGGGNVRIDANVELQGGNVIIGTSGNGINDANNNEAIKFTATASAVNELTVANAATGNNPVVSATGGDTNIGITLTPKGSGNTFVSANNLIISAAALPTISGEGSPKAIRLNDALIISGSGSIASPYSQNIQIDIVWGNWGSNPALALVDLSVALREFAGTAGCVFGTLFAINSSGATFTSFTTAGITTSQATLTATSPANYTLRITIDPTSGTDRYGYYLTIPTMAGGTASTVESVTVSLV
jgi:hypothetical protein